MEACAFFLLVGAAAAGLAATAFANSDLAKLARFFCGARRRIAGLTAANTSAYLGEAQAQIDARRVDRESRHRFVSDISGDSMVARDCFTIMGQLEKRGAAGLLQHSMPRCETE